MREQFEQRVELYSKKYSTLNKQYNFIATVRLLVFVAFVIVFILFANYKMGSELGLSVLLFPFVFGLIVKSHQKIKYQRQHAKFLKEINEREILIYDGKLKELEEGKEYLDKNHPYANDLDIFGSNSIFQLINRTTTKGGKDTVANWLLSGADKQEILERQEASIELSEKIDWRQDFEARGMHFEMQQTNSDLLIDWIKRKSPVPFPFKIAAYIMPIVIIISMLLNAFTAWPFFMTLIFLAISGFVLNRFQDQLTKLTESVIKHISVLGAYSTLIAKLEETDFESKKLKSIKSSVIHDKYKASESIQRLYKILDFLNARSNFFYMIIDVILLFDLHIIFLAENWKKKNEADVANWFKAISEMEAISSLAAYHNSNPDYIKPTIAEEEFHIEALSLGHPLIKKHERRSNDYVLSGKGSISIITGSNMSGKSTFLRTLGVNLILAQAGAVVCAKTFNFSLVQLFTSMRTQDNLEEHVSSFYAELQRIKDLLGLVEKKMPVLYMLDEILKGTNSHDRHIGAVSLAKQLTNTNSFGLISTHDLALGDLANSMSNISNYSFNSVVEGEEIIFPYKLDKSICKSFNASKLMEKIGIKIDESIKKES